jgi:hypothetical protein
MKASRYVVNPAMNPVTSFLSPGPLTILDPEGDGARISTNIPSYTYPARDYFSPVARGSLYPGAPTTTQGGYATFTSHEDQTFLHDLESYNAGAPPAPRACSDRCTLGGCRDPTSSVHRACVARGCCVTRADFPYVSAPPFDSQRVYVETNCDRDGHRGHRSSGKPEFCQSDLDYFNCHPWSVETRETDPLCRSRGAHTHTPRNK